MDTANGLLLIDKPSGMSSSQCVQKVRSLLGVRKAGHTGTLDPMATGLLPVCCGKATRLAELLLIENKSYQATISLGSRTDTGDTEGQIVDRCDIPLINQLQLDHLAKTLTGEQTQLPPVYSAIKINGKPMYAWAREHKEHPDRPLPSLQPRNIEIYSLEMTMTDSEHINLVTSCSKGTYIRSLGEKIAEKLGTLGHLSQLRRTACGSLKADNAMKLSYLEQPNPDFSDSWLTIEDMVTNMPRIDISREDSKKITNGLPLELPNNDLRGIIALMSEARLVALAAADIDSRTLTPVKVFRK